MQFLAPTLLASLALVPLYVWLRLRQRRPPVAVVSSLLLWKAVPPAPLEALARRERLWNLVLLIEGLSLALVCAALARPFVMRETTRPVHLVLGIDDSASMGARDRWTRIQARAKELLAKLEDDDVATLLTNQGEKPRIAPKEALAAIERLAPSKIEDDLDGLLDRARAVAGAEEGAVVRILTDRIVPDAPEVESFGGPVDNAGIVEASFNPAMAGGVHDPFPEKEVFVLVAATSPRRVHLRVRDERVNLASGEVEVSEGVAPILIPVRPAVTGPLIVELIEKDAFAQDDEVRRDFTHSILRVRIDTPGNPELVRALSVQPGVEVVVGSVGEAHLVVLDRTWYTPENWHTHLPSPLGSPRSGGLVVIAPPAECFFRGKQEVTGPIETWKDDEKLLEGLAPEAVGLVRCSPLLELGPATVFATAGGKPVISEIHMEATGGLYIGFDVSLAGGESTWATHPHFPVFWSRVVQRYAGHFGRWSPSGLLSRKETLCAGLSTPGGPIDLARTRVVSSPRFFAAHALVAAALGFSLAFLLARKANGWRSSSSSTTR